LIRPELRRKREGKKHTGKGAQENQGRNHREEVSFASRRIPNTRFRSPAERRRQLGTTTNLPGFNRYNLLHERRRNVLLCLYAVEVVTNYYSTVNGGKRIKTTEAMQTVKM
jgi:hypothetical protein